MLWITLNDKNGVDSINPECFGFKFKYFLEIYILIKVPNDFLQENLFENRKNRYLKIALVASLKISLKNS